MGVYGQGEIVAGKIGPKEAAAAGQTLKRLFVFARRRKGKHASLRLRKAKMERFGKGGPVGFGFRQGGRRFGERMPPLLSRCGNQSLLHCTGLQSLSYNDVLQNGGHQVKFFLSGFLGAGSPTVKPFEAAGCNHPEQNG